MNTMNIPGFTAEDSLYRTNSQYRTDRQIIYSSLLTVSSINPAVIRGEVPIDVPGEEIIPVHSCAPGWIDIGGSCWPIPLTELSSGGSSGAPVGGSAGSRPGGGVGGGKPPKVKPKKPQTDAMVLAERIGRKWNRECRDPNGNKWLKCCDDNVARCMRAAKETNNVGFELVCIDAGHFCRGDNPYI